MINVELGVIPQEADCEKKCKSVFDPGIARHLLQAGCVLADVKPDKHNKTKTIFLFLNDEHFRECLKNETNK
jgi:hypothetical protein